MNVILIILNMIIGFCISKFLFGLGADGILFSMVFSNSIMLAIMSMENK